MANKYNARLTDEQVEQEIHRLSESPMVKLARKEIRVRNRRRQYLYHLRQMKKHDRRMHDQKYDRAWPQVLALLATLAITVFFCCGFVRALEMAAW